MESNNMTQVNNLLMAMAIRPYRNRYYPFELGPNEIKGSDGKIISIREDIQVPTSRGLKMECSFFPINNGKKNPCIIFLHGNGGNRKENVNDAELFLELGIQSCCYDFIGCGISEGETISFGYHESRDLEDLMNYLNSHYQINKFLIHGLSMGGATTLMCCSFTKNNICGIIIDSCFSDISVLIQGYTNLPLEEVDKILEILNVKILEKYKFPIKDLKPIKDVPQIKIPALFIYAEYEKQSYNIQFQKLFTEYGCPKEIMSFQGGHNSIRPKSVYDKIFEFCKKYALS